MRRIGKTLAVVVLGLLLAAGAITAATTNPPEMYYTAANGIRRYLKVKLAETCSVTDWGAFTSNSDNSAAFALSMANCRNVTVPWAPSCYAAASTISIPSGITLRGDGYGSPDAGASCITSTVSTCAVLLDSVKHAALLNIDVHLNSSSSTGADVCIKSTTSVAEFNRIEDVSLTADQVRVTGQVGLLLEDVANGIYWNTVKTVRFRSWDTSMFLHSSGTTQGTNSNTFIDLMSYAHNTAYLLRAGTKQVTDNRFFSLACSRSDGTLSTNQNCMMMGDDNVAGVFANAVYGLNNDSGSPSVCGVLGTRAGANIVEAVCESGGGFQDNRDPTLQAFPNRVYNQLGLGSLVGLLSLGTLNVTNGATIIGSSFFGITGGGASSSGGTVQIGGGATGAAGQPGGELQLLGGTGLGQTNGSGGSVLVRPGTRNGTGAGGAVILGPPAGLSVGSGTKIQSGRVTKYTKPFGINDCGAGPSQSATVSLLAEGSRFSTSAACTLTIPTAAGASGIVQSMVASSSAPVSVGECFDFTMISIGANYTLAAGAGVTILGNATISNTKKEWEVCVTSVATNSETVVVY